MTSRNEDLRDCLTAYDCRDRLPELSAWMTDDALKQIPIWRGNRFERGRTYFDLDNPERGPFVASCANATLRLSGGHARAAHRASARGAGLP